MVIPAILEKTIEETLLKASLFETVTTLLHIDIGDGEFVNHSSIFRPENLPGTFNFEYQVHLMVKNPHYWIEDKVDQVSTVIFQAETTENYLETAAYFKNFGYKVGMSINPTTPPPEVFDNLDFIQFMTVEPGMQGGKFIENVVEKIRVFKGVFPSVKVQADGGITLQTIGDLKTAGASNFAVGSYILKAENPINAFMEIKNNV